MMSGELYLSLASLVSAALGEVMSKSTFVLFLVLSGMAAHSYADQPFVRKAESSVSESSGPEGTVKTVVNTTFSVGTLYDSKSQNFSDVLFYQRIESKYVSGREGADSFIDVVAWITRKTKYDTKLWAIKAGADAGGRWGDFYRTINYGCCGAEDSYNVFDIRTGKHAFSYTAEPVFVDIPNTPIKREISYISSNAASDFSYAKDYPRGVGVLTISSQDSIIDQVIFESDDGELAWSPKLSLTDEKEPKGVSRLSLWHSNGKGGSDNVKAFSVKLVYYEGMEIIVPVNGDRFDIQKIVLPKAVSVRHLAMTHSNRK